MSKVSLPYMNAYGNIPKALNKIKKAATPDRFTQDFLATKLGLSGGSPKPVIPYLKRTGFLGSDGVPTEQYKKFRNPSESGRAAAKGLRIGYQPLFQMNEYVYDLNDKDLMGLIVQATGLEANSEIPKRILASFKALHEFATFDEEYQEDVETDDGIASEHTDFIQSGTDFPKDMNISYTINLNLPSTSDIAVFNAIFKSLREHLLRE